MNSLEDVKKSAQNFSEKLKGNDNYLTSSLVLAGTAVIIVVGVLIITLLKPAFLPKTLQNQIGYDQTPTNAPTLTPTPRPLPQGPQEYAISNSMNPQVRYLKISDFDPRIGVKQKIDLKIIDSEGGKIISAELRLISDNKSKVYPMSLFSGTDTDGEWSTTIITEDTHNYVYTMEFTVVNNKGARVTVPAAFR